MPDEFDPYLEERFPKLRAGLYRVMSPTDPKYNCIAFAANDTQHFWQYTGPGRLGGYFWPDEVKGDDTLQDWVRVYRLLGFVDCDNADLEPDIVKIAIYVESDGTPSHVAKQTRRGSWKSKLGRGKDIEHDALELLEGNQKDEYGTVAQIMKRRRYEWEDIDM